MAVRRLRPGRFKPRELLADVGLAGSRSEAERLLRQRAVKRDGAVVEAGIEIELAPGAGFVLSVGSSRFVRVLGAEDA
jgi:tyrosyl-tRNA synthetase